MKAVGVLLICLVRLTVSSLPQLGINDCNLEANQCMWYVSDENQYVGMKWKKVSPKSKETGRGPDQDHTFFDKNFKAAGSFMHVEGEIWNNETNEETTFRSTKFSTPILKKLPKKGVCLKFWYWGDAKGSLRIIYWKRHRSDGPMTLWRLEKHHEKKWMQGQVSIKSCGKFELYFEARTEVTDKDKISDYALDDITFTYGSCKEKGDWFNTDIPAIPTKTKFEKLEENEVIPKVFRTGCFKDGGINQPSVFPFKNRIDLAVADVSEKYLVNRCYNVLKNLMYYNKYFAIQDNHCLFGPDRMVKHDRYGSSAKCFQGMTYIVPKDSLSVYKWDV